MNLQSLSSYNRLIEDYYILGDVVGTGAFGNVQKALHKATKKLVAVKTFRQQRTNTKYHDTITPTICREIALLNELNHANIVKLKEIIVNTFSKEIYVILEYAEYDFYEIIRAYRLYRKYIPEGMIKSMLWQLLNGIHYLHSNWIMHRDLKPSNLLMMKGEEEGTVKIADLGLARIFQSPLLPLSENGLVVTIWYRAPELLLGSRHYTRAVDTWAIGCIFGELMTTNPLFAGTETKANFQNNQLLKISERLGPLTPQIWSKCVNLPYWSCYMDMKLEQNTEKPLCSLMNNYSQNAVDLMQRMLRYNPEERISAFDALNHDYFKEPPFPSSNSLFYHLEKVILPNRSPKDMVK